MKKTLLFSLVLLSVGALFAQDSRVQDHTRWNLPEGALSRLGKRAIGEVAYSTDGTLAVATSLGIWLYNARTLSEAALHQGHTDWAFPVSFSPDTTVETTRSPNTTFTGGIKDEARYNRNCSGADGVQQCGDAAGISAFFPA